MGAMLGGGCNPTATDPSGWVKEQRMSLLLACANDGVGNTIMDVLRAMEIWGRDNYKRIDEVRIEAIEWVGGDLVVEFA